MNRGLFGLPRGTGDSDLRNFTVKFIDFLDQVSSLPRPPNDRIRVFSIFSGAVPAHKLAFVDEDNLLHTLLDDLQDHATRHEYPAGSDPIELSNLVSFIGDFDVGGVFYGGEPAPGVIELASDSEKMFIDAATNKVTVNVSTLLGPPTGLTQAELTVQDTAGVSLQHLEEVGTATPNVFGLRSRKWTTGTNTGKRRRAASGNVVVALTGHSGYADADTDSDAAAVAQYDTAAGAPGLSGRHGSRR